MTTPILATKFYIPPLRSDLVRRPQLLRKLAASLRHPLTIVCAPAGFGKTTLLVEWLCSLSAQNIDRAWVALEPDERDPLRFVDCLRLALGALCPELAVIPTAVAPLTPQSKLAELITALHQLSRPCVVVLDDYHAVTEPAIHELVAYFIHHLPPHVHLILASRSEPPLPLARLRLRAGLTEIRTDDLRFTHEESAEFLTARLGLPLAQGDVDALTVRTEGWVAGLKLAALSLINESPTEYAAFVQAFTGSHRYVADYLVEEVLASQPEIVRNFLLHTATLSLLCGPLCDAVTGARNSQALLEQLEQQNLFINRLDDARYWYRYHQLFADLLRRRLDLLQPGLAKQLQRRAVAWYEENDLLECAIDEALDAREFAIAADLIVRAHPEQLVRGQRATVERWLRALPPQMVRATAALHTLWLTMIDNRLTSREVEIIELVAQGASNRAIAQSLIVSLGTVKKHLNNIFSKLNATNRTQAVAQARELGLL